MRYRLILLLAAAPLFAAWTSYAANKPTGDMGGDFSILPVCDEDNPLPGCQGSSDDGQGEDDEEEKPPPKPPEQENPQHPQPFPMPTYPTDPGQGTFNPIEDAINGGDTDSALEAIRRIQETNPDSPTANKYKAMILSNQGDAEGAMEAINAGLRIAPGDHGLKALQKLVLPRVKSPFSDKELKERARQLGAQQAPPEKAEDKKEQIERGGWMESAIQNKSVRTFGQVQGKHDLTAPGLAKLQMKDYRGAEQSFTRIIQSDPDNWAAFRFRAMTRHKMKNYQGAIDDATSALRRNPKDGWSYKVRAQALIDAQRYAEAKKDLDAALALNRRDADAYATRALIWERLGQVEEKLADLQRAAYLDPAFKDLFRQGLADKNAGANPPQKPRSGSGRLWIYGGAGALCLLFLAFALFRRSNTMITQAPADAEESVIGYDILGKLGEGGMGEVYAAMDRALQRKVAIKKMREEIAGNPRERKRFLKEARTVAGLKHANIVEIYSVLEEGGGLYLVFEHMPGESMYDLLAKKGRLPLSEALPYLRQIAPALDYAHAQGVIHQDLKPGNIMVSNGTAKVMDFGIARRAQDTLSTVSRMEVSGTPSYMAPEQEQGKVVPQSDVYALAACLYELLAGQTPFQGAACHPMKLQKAYVPLSRLVAGLPKELDILMDRALEPDPAKRFQTAGELVAALEKVPA
ncbi:MAG: protein kinase [Elusimicrobiota bacterium]